MSNEVAKAKTGKGKEITITVQTQELNGKLRKKFRFTIDGREYMLNDKPFATVQGFKVVKFPNPEINKEAFGVKKPVMAKLTDQDANIADLNKAGDELIAQHEEQKKEEGKDLLEKMSGDTELKFMYVFHPEGRSVICTSIENDYASAELDEMAKELDEQGKTDFRSEGYPGESDMVWTVTYGELKEKYNKLKSEKDEEKKKVEEEEKQKFEEAKKTGEPVVLSSVFLTGESIPYQYREKDSDMGTLVTYAMPDGSEKEQFNHTY